MKTIKVAGIGISLAKKDSLTYEQLMEMALNSPEYYRKKDAKKLIDKELKANGFKPSKTKSQKNQSRRNRGAVQEDTSRE